MQAFGALLWIAAFSLVAAVCGIALVAFGTDPKGWQATSKLYVISSLLTLPLPPLLLRQEGLPSGLGPLVLLAAVRLIACLPLCGVGLALIPVIAKQNRQGLVALLLLSAAFNAGTFVLVFQYRS